MASGAYADPADAKWSVIDVRFLSRWPQRVSLAQMKSRREAELKGLILFEQARLSVQPVSEEHYEYIKGLGRGDERRERKHESRKLAIGMADTGVEENQDQ